MDKLRVTNHIKDDDLRIKMYRVVDICNSVLKNYEYRQTDFLNPFEIKNAVAIVNSNQDLACRIDGGYDDAERSVLSIFPYYQQVESSDVEISFLQIDGNFKFSSVSHRDYLGAILGLGIKREKIGDILVHEDYCQLIVESEISDYIIYNLDKVGNNRVSLKSIDRSDIIKSSQTFDERSLTISSLRLDNIISSVFKLSRQEATKLIDSGFVSVNYEKIYKNSSLVEGESVISVRKKGKFILSEVGDTTRKGKIKIKTKIFV
ncbi:RNA-binding protein [Peptostreptococcus russellii]|uniref:YlmH family RNA-binding protein n=1 Tax=Peptostreptococcus russellii TaxID=215200 RepID=UPI003F58B05E